MRNERKVSAQIGMLFVLTTVFIALCLFVPVWQSAQNTQLKMLLAKEETRVSSMEEQKMLLVASVEMQKTPEYVMKTASARNINFSQIPSMEAGAVASSR